MGVQAAFAVLLLFIPAVKAYKGNIEIWRKDVTLTCPEDGKWFGKEGSPLSGDGKQWTFEYDGKNNGPYYCKYGEEDDQKKYIFYVKAKVCKNCFELDATLFGLIIVVDVIATACLMMIVYRCTKKKGPARNTNSAKPSSRPGPPTPSPDYEQLNPHTRSQDTYSMVNRTG